MVQLIEVVLKVNQYIPCWACACTIGNGMFAARHKKEVSVEKTHFVTIGSTLCKKEL